MNHRGNKYFWIVTTMVLTIGYVISCTKHDQVLGITAAVSGTTLVSKKVSGGPTIDGTIDDAWKNAAKISVAPTVPDPGNLLFAGYIGEKYPVTLRSMYDDQNIYFLAEWADPSNSSNPVPWYFDPVAKRWNQEVSSRSFDKVNGILTREGWGEDKIAFLWNIDFSTPKFITQTCYASCHVFAPYTDNTGAYKDNMSSGNHYTNGQNEKIDMWWGRLGYMSKSPALNFIDDNYQDWAGGPAYSNLTGGNSNGRHVDDIYPDGTSSTTWPYRPNYTTSPAQGEINNRISLKMNGNGGTVNVPLYVYVSGSNGTAGNFILASDTAVTAKRVVGVDSSGVLTFTDGTKLDPNVSTDYNRTGDAVTGGVGAKSIPGYIAAPLLGGRADITGAAIYAGGKWVVEFKRKLKTADGRKQDVDFSSLADQPFGVAIWNASNYQHGIQPNLLLHFEK
jgi:hypothetical protein